MSVIGETVKIRREAWSSTSSTDSGGAGLTADCDVTGATSVPVPGAEGSATRRVDVGYEVPATLSTSTGPSGLGVIRAAVTGMVPSR